VAVPSGRCRLNEQTPGACARDPAVPVRTSSQSSRTRSSAAWPRLAARRRARLHRRRRPPDFHLLRRRFSATDARSATRLAAAHAATLIIFDLLHLDDSSPALSYARRTLLEQELPATVRPGGRRLRSSATSRRCWRSRASSGSRESWPRASTPPTSPATEPAVVQAQPPPPLRNPSRSPAGGQRRPTRVAQGPSSSRAESDSTLIPAGSAELGLTGAEREQLRRRRAAPPSPSATLLRAVARIASIPGIWVDVDFHGSISARGSSPAGSGNCNRMPLTSGSSLSSRISRATSACATVAGRWSLKGADAHHLARGAWPRHRWRKRDRRRRESSPGLVPARRPRPSGGACAVSVCRSTATGRPSSSCAGG